MMLYFCKEWKDFLTAFGWQHSEARLESLCRFLVSSELFKWHQLKGTPGKWQGANAFDSSELAILERVQEIGSQRPRYVCGAYVS